MSFLNGDERITGTEATIQQFWKWSASRLLDNTLRGIFAEWLVGLALDALEEPREEWAPHDLSTDGITIEVKSSAYYQSWSQGEKKSTPIFRIAKTRAWTPEDGYEETAKRQSDVYVFALFAGKTSKDALQITNWQFYVVATSKLDDELPNQASLGMTRLKEIAGKPVDFDQLATAVRERVRKTRTTEQFLIPTLDHGIERVLSERYVAIARALLLPVHTTKQADSWELLAAEIESQSVPVVIDGVAWNRVEVLNQLRHVEVLLGAIATLKGAYSTITLSACAPTQQSKLNGREIADLEGTLDGKAFALEAFGGVAYTNNDKAAKDLRSLAKHSAPEKLLAARDSAWPRPWVDKLLLRNGNCRGRVRRFLPIAHRDIRVAELDLIVQ